MISKISFCHSKIFLQLATFQHLTRLHGDHLWRWRPHPLVQNWAVHLLHRLLRRLSVLLRQHLRRLDHRHLQRAWRGGAWGRHGQEPEVLHRLCHKGKVKLDHIKDQVDTLLQASWTLCAWWDLRAKVGNVIFVKGPDKEIPLELGGERSYTMKYRFAGFKCGDWSRRLLLKTWYCFLSSWTPSRLWWSSTR